MEFAPTFHPIVILFLTHAGIQWKIGCAGLATVLLAACTSSTTNSPVADPSSVSNANIPVIHLTQTGCQFLETEAKDHQFKTQQPEDCNQLNRNTLSDRQAHFKPLTLKAGKYRFQVTNRDVPYELGFYLRGEGLSQAILPKVSGGGLTQGRTQTYEIELQPGKYLFSCPLNPTPDYPVNVEA
jgi:hypothetical protein